MAYCQSYIVLSEKAPVDSTWCYVYSRFCKEKLQTHEITYVGANVVEHALTSNETEVLSFRLGNEEYGISILKVQEIRGYDAVTQLANSPSFIKGVVNLRGVIVPIVDMRIKFGVGDPTYDQFTVVIILNIGCHVIGMVVDSVSDVINLSSEQIKAAPEMGTALNTDYLIGLGTIDERMLVLLDIDKLMFSDEMGLIATLAA